MLTPPRSPREFFLPDDGSATVEYVIGIITAAAFAVGLLVLIKGEAVMARLRDMVDQALSVP